MTIWGAQVGVVFVVCYVGMLVSTGLAGNRSKALQWGCWLVALAVMLICHSLTPA